MRRLAVLLLMATAALSAPADAATFRVDELQGVFNFSAGYGFLTRLEGRDDDLVGIGNGGNLPSVNGDDGNLNYDTGLVANQVRLTGELTLVWRQFGAVVSGYGFYDFETKLEDRARTELSDDAEWLVGTGAGLQDAYVTGRFAPGGMPVVVRIGNQVINWGETGFLRFGVDTINPIDLIALTQPTTTGRDLFVRQGMIWGAANVTEILSVEGFYQYDWEPVPLPPVGSFFAGNDLTGGDGNNAAFEGFGGFSDQGTDLDARFGAPLGGFDPDFMKIFSGGRSEPSDQGQFGFTVQAFVPELNSTKLALHFVNYHSRLPLISGFTADQDAINDAQGDLVGYTTLLLAEGFSPEEAASTAETLSIGNFTNATRYFVTYPENIRMLGLSFATATIQTGTLVSGEISHHFDWPVQTPVEEVLIASLSPIGFTDDFSGTSLGEFGASEVVPGFVRAGKTQLSFGLTQLLGPQIWASQSLLNVDVGWIHIHDLPGSDPFDADSWGYRVIGGLTYDGVFGGLTLRPSVVWIHDVGGTTPSPGGGFIEGRKAITVVLDADYQRTITASLGYTNVFGGRPLNDAHDRDFLLFNVIFHY